MRCALRALLDVLAEAGPASGAMSQPRPSDGCLQPPARRGDATASDIEMHGDHVFVSSSSERP
jgi:hypothetical protein